MSRCVIVTEESMKKSNVRTMLYEFVITLRITSLRIFFFNERFLLSITLIRVAKFIQHAMVLKNNLNTDRETLKLCVSIPLCLLSN